LTEKGNILEFVIGRRTFMGTRV